MCSNANLPRIGLHSFAYESGTIAKKNIYAISGQIGTAIFSDREDACAITHKLLRADVRPIGTGEQIQFELIVTQTVAVLVTLYPCTAGVTVTGTDERLYFILPQCIANPKWHKRTYTRMWPLRFPT
jgi:hypothetical protein